nr:uncharacterized protein LOC107454385 [Parasteatoda tepidariorum]
MENKHVFCDAMLQEAMFIIKHGKLEDFEHLLEECLDINTIILEDSSSKIIHIASLFSRCDIIELLLTKGVEVSETDREGSTALHYAAEKGHLEIVKILIRNGANASAEVYDIGSKYCHIASKFGRRNILEFFFSEGGNANETDKVGWTLLHYAAENNDVDFVEYIVDNGANIHAESNDTGMKPIHIASQSGCGKVLDYFLFKGVDVDTVNKLGYTSLHLAASEGKLETVEVLLKHKANIHAADEDGNQAIHFSSKFGHRDVLNFLLHNGSNVQDVSENFYTPLHFAALNGNLDVILDLIENGANINAKIKYGESSLHLAVKSGNVNVVKYFLDLGLKINDKDDDGWTPLHYASLCGHIGVVKLLINNGANIYCKKNDGLKPIHVAAGNGHTQTVEYYINKGCDVNELNTNPRWTCLHYASQKGLLKMVQYLFYNHANIHVESSDYGKAIHVAALEGKTKIIEFFISVGMSIDEHSSKKWTPLHWASIGGKLETIEYLVQKRANIYAKTYENYSVLHLAAKHGHKNVIEYFLNLGLDFNKRDKKGWKPLHHAACAGAVDIVKLLVEKGADYVEMFGRVAKPLHIAAKNGHVEVIKTFIELGQDPNSLGPDGPDNNTPLHIAAEKDTISVINFLVEKGANPHITNSEGEKPIHIAARHGNKKVVELFLNMGISVDEKNEDDWTPLHYSIVNQQLELVKYLVNRKANIKSRTNVGVSPLCLAAMFRPLRDIYRHLCKHEDDLCDLNFRNRRANEEILEFLIKKDAEINAVNKQGWTALHYAIGDAVGMRVLYIVEKLIEAGAKPDIQDTDGNTPLHLGIEERYTWAVSKMLEANPNLDIKNKEGETLLYLACRNQLTDIMIMLLEAGANPDIKDNDGRTFIYYYIHEYLVSYDDENLLNAESILGKIKSFTDIDDKENNSAVHLSAEGLWNFDFFKLVVSHQKDVNVIDANGDTPLNYLTEEWALSQGEDCISFIKHLIDSGAYFRPIDCQRILENNQVRDVIFTDVKLCSKSIVNKFNKVDLPALYRSPLFSYLPPIDKIKLNRPQIHNIEINVEKEILSNGYCDVSTMLPPLLVIASVVSLAKYYGQSHELKCMMQLKKSHFQEPYDGPSAVVSEKLITNCRNNRGLCDSIDSAKPAFLKANMQDVAGLLPRAIDSEPQNVDLLLIEQQALNNQIGILLPNNLHNITSENITDFSFKMENKRKFCDVVIQEAMFIIKHGTLDEFERLLEEGLDTNAIIVENRCSKMIHVASYFGRCDIIELLITKGVCVSETDKQGRKPLHYAAEKGHLEIVKILIRNGANASAGGGGIGSKYCHFASRFGRRNILEFFFSEGGDANETDEIGWTLLHYAAVNNDVDIVEYLVDNGANIHAEQFATGMKPMHIASEYGCEKVVDYFLLKGAGVDTTNKFCNTSLHLAASEGKLETVEVLLKHKANIHAADEDGNQAIHLSSKYGHRDVLNFLLHSGSNVQAVGENFCTPLHFAALNGHLNLIHDLIENGANINAKNKYGESSLHLAVKSGNVNAVEYFLTLGLKINARDDDYGWTPLHYASRCGHIGVIELLINNGADVNGRSNGGEKPIHVAANNGHTQTVEFYINKGCDVNELNTKYHWTCLHYASREGFLEMVQYLFDKHADIHVECSDYGKAIHIAAIIGQTEIIEFFISIGMSIEEPSSKKWTPLHWASKGGKLETIEYLVQNKVNIFAKTYENYSVLHLAAKHGHKNVIEYFLNLGLDFNERNKKGWQPLHYAARKGAVDIVSLLVEKGADYDEMFGRVAKPLHVAAQNGHVEVIKTFIELGQDPNSFEPGNNTPLHKAAEKGTISVINFLVEKGADSHIINSKGEKPIHIAARHGNKEVVDLFLNMGISVDEKSKDDWTPMHYSITYHQLELVKYLVNREAKPSLDIKNIEGETPLHLAYKNKRTDIMIMLLEAGANPDIKDNGGRTFLYYYIHEYVERLVSYDDDRNPLNAESILSKITCFTDIDDKGNKSAVHLSAEGLWNLDFFKLILSHQKDVNVIDANGDTPLNYLTEEWALSQGEDCISFINHLIDSGAYFKPEDCQRILENHQVRDVLFTDVNLCSKSIVNKFNKVELPALYRSPVLSYLPPIDKMKLNRPQIQSIEINLEKEILNNGYCDVSTMLPPLLVIASVVSLAKYYGQSHELK